MPVNLQRVVTALRAAGCVYAEEEAELLIAEADDEDDLAALIRRRSDGEPIEHLLGWASFAGLRLAVTSGVFVPRRRTELLAREAARLIRPGGLVVELCCGCAPVSAVVAATAPQVSVAAADIDPVAAACAALNLPRSAPTYCGDLFEPLPERFTGRIDVLVANAPYVPSDALDLMPREARLYEPVEALDGGADGLDVHRRLLAGAGDWQPAAGHLLVEVAEEQVPTAVALFHAHGYRPAVVRDPEIGGTVIVGRRTVEPGVSVR